LIPLTGQEKLILEKFQELKIKFLFVFVF